MEGRAAGDLQLVNGKDGREVLRRIEASVAGRGGSGGNGGGRFGRGGVGNRNGGDNAVSRPREEEIQLRATGRAIQKALQIAVQLQGEEGLKVRFETGSVGAVDDIVEKPATQKEGKKDEGGDADAEEGEKMDVDGDDGEDEVEIEESRVRRVSCLIIFVGLK